MNSRILIPIGAGARQRGGISTPADSAPDHATRDPTVCACPRRTTIEEIQPTDEQATRTRIADAELEVLCLIGQGLATEDIARLLHRSPHTIEVHRRSIGRKLGDTNRVALARLAMEAGLTLGDADRERMSRRGPTPT